jgi:hypothetical protein
MSVVYSIQLIALTPGTVERLRPRLAGITVMKDSVRASNDEDGQHEPSDIVCNERYSGRYTFT